jgi:hypothetical protein
MATPSGYGSCSQVAEIGVIEEGKVMDDYTFKVVMIRDNGTPYVTQKEWTYDNALEAVSSYKLVLRPRLRILWADDMADRASGLTHTETFLTRGIDDEVRERLGTLYLS